MAALVTSVVTRAGGSVNPQTANNSGDTCEVGANIYLEVRNTGGSSIDVTIAIPSSSGNFSNVAYTSTKVTVPATTGAKRIGPLNAELYADPTTGRAAISYSATPTGVTVEPVKIQN